MISPRAAESSLRATAAPQNPKHLMQERPCTTRRPVVGDTVHTSDGTGCAVDQCEEDGWTLAAGAVAIVAEVDGD
jgi:hypothetical protein